MAVCEAHTISSLSVNKAAARLGGVAYKELVSCLIFDEKTAPGDMTLRKVLYSFVVQWLQDALLRFLLTFMYLVVLLRARTIFAFQIPLYLCHSNSFLLVNLGL